MRNFILLALLIFLGAGCGKSPDHAAAELLKAGDRSKALQILEVSREKNPEHAPTRYLLFVLYQYHVAQGEPSKQEAFLNSAINEYSWIAKQAGFSPDYKDMEGTLKSGDKTRAPYETAYSAVYAR